MQGLAFEEPVARYEESLYDKHDAGFECKSSSKQYDASKEHNARYHFETPSKELVGFAAYLDSRLI